MSKLVRTAAGLAACAFFLAGPAFALGPIEGEVGAVWWAHDASASEGGVGGSTDAGAPGYRAELWFFDRVGLRAGMYSSDLDELGGPSADYTSVDVLWRAFSPTENNFFALGAGWEQMDLLGLSEQTSGARVSVEGRIGLAALVYLYGHGSYVPSLDDTAAVDPTFGRFEDMDGREIELGVSWKTFPFMSLRAGWRTQSIDYTRTGFTPLPGGETEMSGEIESEGWLAGASFRF